MDRRSEQVALALALVDMEQRARAARVGGDRARLEDLVERARRLEQHLGDTAPGVAPRSIALEAVTSCLMQVMLDARHARDDGQPRLASAFLERAQVLEQIACALEAPPPPVWRSSSVHPGPGAPAAPSG